MIEMSLLNVILFLLIGLALAIIVVLFFRWVAGGK